MKRYLLSFLGSYLGSLLAFGLILLIALSQWMFSETPLWFDILCVIAVTLPLLAFGQMSGRHPGKHPPQKSWIGLVVPVVYHLGWCWGREK